MSLSSVFVPCKILLILFRAASTTWRRGRHNIVKHCRSPHIQDQEMPSKLAAQVIRSLKQDDQTVRAARQDLSCLPGLKCAAGSQPSCACSVASYSELANKRDQGIGYSPPGMCSVCLLPRASSKRNDGVVRHVSPPLGKHTCKTHSHCQRGGEAG